MYVFSSLNILRVLEAESAPQLFKTFRALWSNLDTEFSPENVTATYLRKYIQDTNAKSKVKYSGDFKDFQFYLDAFGHRAGYIIGTAVKKRDIERRSWNGLLGEFGSSV